MMNKKMLLGTALGLTLGASAVSAEPVILSKQELDNVTAGFFFGEFGDFFGDLKFIGTEIEFGPFSLSSGISFFPPFPD